MIPGVIKILEILNVDRRVHVVFIRKVNPVGFDGKQIVFLQVRANRRVDILVPGVAQLVGHDQIFPQLQTGIGKIILINAVVDFIQQCFDFRVIVDDADQFSGVIDFFYRLRLSGKTYNLLGKQTFFHLSLCRDNLIRPGEGWPQPGDQRA